MVRWLRWHCPPDTGFEIRALAVWGRARYLSVTEAPHNTNFHTWMGKKQFCFFQTAGTGNRTPDSGVKGSGANHYPRAPALVVEILDYSDVISCRREASQVMIVTAGNGRDNEQCNSWLGLGWLSAKTDANYGLSVPIKQKTFVLHFYNVGTRSVSWGGGVTNVGLLLGQRCRRWPNNNR